MIAKRPHELFQAAISRTEVRYIASGIASEIIEIISFVILMELWSNLIGSNSISFILGIASGFVFHKLWSFAGEQQFKTHQQVVGYAILATINFIATNIIISLFVNQLDILPNIAKLLTMSIVAVWSYLIFNKVIFRKRKV